MIIIRERLEEKLVKVTQQEIKLLGRQLTQDQELNRMLTTPMRDVPQYKYLYNDPAFDRHPLLDAVSLFVSERRSNFYFSKAGSKFTGFVVYEDNGRVISSIKTASFLDDKKKANPTLAKDLIEFVLDKANERDAIEWWVDPQNSNAIRQYNTILSRKGLNWKFIRDEKWLKYIVNGYKA